MSITFLSRHPRVLSAAVAAAALTVGACDQEKSSNPLSDSIAGPMAGINITVPKTLEPGNGWEIEDKNQPITLLIENSSSNSVRPFKLMAEVATDAAFANKVFSSGPLAPGSNGRTALKLPDKLTAGLTYYWRVMADDGANKSDWSSATPFDVLIPVVIGTPTPKSPVGNVRTTTLQPTLVATNGISTGPYGPLFYRFDLSTSAAFGPETASVDVPENAIGETSFAIPAALPYDKPYFWRVRISDGKDTGAWSSTASFRTPIKVTNPGPGGSCASTDGPSIVACIEARYPQYLVPTSSSQREANMEFLRDRVIEAGRCGGLDLAWNLKRGGPTISTDFIAFQDGPILRGIDIGYDYDNNNTTLRLQWTEGSFPFYGGYQSFSCTGVDPAKR